MPVTAQNMGYDPRNMLAEFYANQRQAMENYNNPDRPEGFSTTMLPPTMRLGSGPVLPQAFGAPVPRLPMPPQVPGSQFPGGALPPGVPALVGDGGDAPEMIVSTGHTQVVPLTNKQKPKWRVPGLPMPALAAGTSPMNRPYAEMPRFAPMGMAPAVQGSLANAPTRAIGRSANDPARAAEMAMRRLRSQGDVVGAARLAQSRQWFDMRGGMPSAPGMRLPMPPQAPSSPFPVPGPMTAAPGLPLPPMDGANPQGNDLPERPAVEPPAPESPQTFDQWYNQSPLAGAGPAPMSQPFPPMQVLSGTLARMPGLDAGAFKGAYQEAPPLMSSVPIPGTDQVQPFVMGQPKGSPVNRTAPAPKAEPPKVPDGIQYEKDALGNITGGKYPAWDEARQTWVIKRMDLDGDGVVSPQERAAAESAPKAPSSFVNALKF